jgi:transposase
MTSMLGIKAKHGGVMAYREVTMLEIKEVLQLWFEGKAKKEIARLIGVDRNTVRRYIKTALKCGISPEMSLRSVTDKQLEEILIQLKSLPSKQIKSPSWKCCENQHEFIKSHLENGVRLTKIHRLLRRQGIEIPYSAIYRFAIKELDFGQKASTIPIVDCEPGEEIQLDTGWMTQLAEPDSSGKRRNFRAWIFTSVYSRHRFVYPCIKETTHTAIEACEAAWKFFGGIFRVIIPDNTKTIVQLADPLEPIIKSNISGICTISRFSYRPRALAKSQRQSTG